jgi:hypothetical protein
MTDEFGKRILKGDAGSLIDLKAEFLNRKSAAKRQTTDLGGPEVGFWFVLSENFGVWKLIFEFGEVVIGF